MIKDFTKGVFSLKYSVFSDGGVLLLDGVDLELIRVPGVGRYRKATVGIGRLGNFRMANGTTKYAKYAKGGTGRFRFYEGMEGNVAVGGSFRQLTAVQKNNFCGDGSADQGWSLIGLEGKNGTDRGIANCKSGRWMTVIDGGCRWMTVKKICTGAWTRFFRPRNVEW